MQVKGNGRPATSSHWEPAEQFRLLQRVHDAVLSGSEAPTAPRPVISESWQRSLAAHVNPDSYRPPIVYASDEVADVRADHPLRQVLPLLRGMLVDIADASQHIMVVTDARGTILWREGAYEVCRSADPVGLCEGTQWAENTIGTNAMGTALAVDAPVQIHSAEHLVRTFHTWSCAAAPIHDPDTGALLGGVDVSGYLRNLHPAVSNLVTATAELAEGHLRMRMVMRDEQLRTRYLPHLTRLGGESGALLTSTGRVLAGEPHGSWPHRLDVRPGSDRVWLPDGGEALLEPLADGYLVRRPRGARPAPRRPALSLAFLRGDRPVATLDGQERPLTLRRAELLALLALHPEGLTAEQLALHLYGEQGNPTTVRAEIHRLRTQLGARAVPTKPYRLDVDLDADFLTVRSALRSGNVRAALAAFHAPLLDRSESPTLRTEREQLAASLRAAVLRSGEHEQMWEYGQRRVGREDIELFERLARELPEHDPRQAVAEARVHTLLAEEA